MRVWVGGWVYGGVGGYRRETDTANQSLPLTQSANLISSISSRVDDHHVHSARIPCHLINTTRYVLSQGMQLPYMVVGCC